MLIFDNDTTRFEPRLQYLHENPMKAGFVMLPKEWKYSSAIGFYTACDGLLKLTEKEEVGKDISNGKHMTESCARPRNL